jgi:cytochrome P450
LPVAVIAELLGVPEADRPLLRPWSNAIVKMYGTADRAAQGQAVAPPASSPTTCAVSPEPGGPNG